MSDVKTPFAIIGNGYLAWDSPEGEEKRFRAIFLIFLLLSLAFSVVVEMTVVPKPDRKEVEKIPERLAKLVVEKKKEEPPPPPKEEKKEEKKEEEKPKEEPKEKPTEVQVQKAREEATKAIAEAREELAALQDLASAFDMGDDVKPLTKAGSAGPGTGTMSRDLITSRSGRGSGGVAIGTSSSGGGGQGVAGGGKLGGAQVAKVESNLGGAGVGEGPARKSASGKLERTEEEIRRMMDRSNGALQAIYQRALRANPTLKGAIVVRLVIAPDGSVTTCDLVSSELNDPETEKKLLTRIRAINFGAIEGVAVWDDKYTLNFFPS